MTRPISRPITLSIDTSVGAVYIKLSDEKIVETVEVTPAVQVDVDATGTVVGVELLSLAAEMPIDVLVRRFNFPDPGDALVLARIPLPGVSYGSSGQAHVFALQPA